MNEEFNLSEKRMEFYRELCQEYPNFKWGMIFQRIFEQDKEFIKRLKEELDNEQVDYANLDYIYKETAMEIIDKLAGEKLK